LEAVGHYKIRRKIGQGGMGVVYEGWDDRLERPVAIKTINEAVVGKEARERLWREARALARVTHPNICQIFDVLEEGESLVLILELLDGQSLAERLGCGVIPSSEALGIERQILRALQALHDLGIVHRDLKPSNVFSTRYGVKLLDFGLARRTEGSFADDPNQTTTGAALTAPGMIVGTPSYMSPEQASGLPAGAAADIFSAGTIFYEMLTGKCPFEGASLVDVLYAVMHQNLPPLSGSREIEALDRVIRRAMCKRAEERYRSASEMLGALETISLSDSTAGRRGRGRYRALSCCPFARSKVTSRLTFLPTPYPTRSVVRCPRWTI